MSRIARSLSRASILGQTIVTQHAFENLVASSPLLEKLILMDYKGLKDIKIVAPNLQGLDIGGFFATIAFGSMLIKLSKVSIDLKDNIQYEYSADVESCITHFCSHLPGIKRLEVKKYFLKYFAAGSVPEGLPNPCFDLYHLSICINLEDLDESLAALCLLKSSPNLIELEIQGRGGALDEGVEWSLWVDYSRCNCPLNKLRSVKMVDVLGARVELDPLRLSRASTRAEIIVLDL